ncbi:MAG: helix-turn-helix transcriptional regulator [Thalassotalea sp.]|nr:helix-turn-helix transcriptional regulator [Thalassotalea sp.]
MEISFLGVIYFVGFSHALMLAISLWFRTEAKKPGRILSIVVAVLAYKLFEGGALHTGLYRHIPHFLDLIPAMVLVLGPVFYAYVRSVTGQALFTTKDWLIHLAPWCAVWLFLNSPNVFRSAELKIAMWESLVNSDTAGFGKLPAEIVLRILAIKTHLSLYLWLSWKSLNQFKSTLPNLRADNSVEVVTQLKFLTLSFILLEIIWVSLFIAHQYFGLGTVNQVSNIWLLFIGVIVLAMGFTGLQKPDLIFTQEERLFTIPQPDLPNSNDESKEGISKVKYIHSALPEKAADDIAKNIEDQLQSLQLYLNDKLTLTDLANCLDIKSHMLSQVINQRMQTNFYRLINSYRVQYAVGLLEDSKINWPIERIALESGFSNRVTFNKAFKEQMNCTASDYKKENTKVSSI